MTQYPRTLMAVLMIATLAACAAPTADSTGTPAPTHRATATATLSVTLTERPTHTPTPAATLEVQHVGTATKIPAPQSGGKSPTRTPTPKPGPQPVIFKPSGDRPDDLHEQLGWGGAGGGMGDPCVVDDTAPGLRAEATFEDGQAIEIPLLAAFEYGIRFYGLKQDVQANLIAPDGSSQPIAILYEGDTSAPYCGWFDIPSHPDMLTGVYRIEVVQGTDFLSYEFKIAYADDARLVGLYDGETATYSYWLAGFQPGEQVRLIAYEIVSDPELGQVAKFYGQQITTLPQGMAVIKDGLPEQSLLYAIGEQSGFVRDPYSMLPQEAIVRPQIDCPGALPPRLWPFTNGRIGRDNLGRVIVRKQPGKASLEVTRLPEGTEFFVSDGPVCSDGWLWWEIYTNDGLSGWLSEGSTRYFVEPIK
jgi:hypothetical protein